MTARPDRENDLPEGSGVIVVPPPVHGGEAHVESLGQLLDRMMFDRRDGRAAEQAVTHLVGSGERPPEPPPIEPPPPVPDGDDVGTRGEPGPQTK